MKNLSSILILSFIALSIQLFGQWATNGNHIYNTNSGFVGIGSSTPATLLYVTKNMTEPAITIRNLGGTGGATFTMIDDESGADWKFKATMTGGFKIRDNTNDIDVFVIEPNSAANTLYINSLGYVGIANPNPAYLLDVAGSIRSTTAQLRITNDFSQAYGQGSFIGWQLGSNKGYTRFVNNQGMGGDQAFRFQSTTDGITFNDIMQLTESGKVGIGTITPGSKLTVSGGDVNIENIGQGIILKSPNGNCWRVTIDNSGNLIRTLITCP